MVLFKSFFFQKVYNLPDLRLSTSWEDSFSVLKELSRPEYFVELLQLKDDWKTNQYSYLEYETDIIISLDTVKHYKPEHVHISRYLALLFSYEGLKKLREWKHLEYDTKVIVPNVNHIPIFFESVELKRYPIYIEANDITKEFHQSAIESGSCKIDPVELDAAYIDVYCDKIYAAFLYLVYPEIILDIQTNLDLIDSQLIDSQ